MKRDTYTTQAQPRERPILFNSNMVRALLAGTKTQTRRVCKAKRDLGSGCVLAPHELAGEVNQLGEYSNSPYGKPGDRLWVREAHYLTDDGHSEYAIFAADGDAVRDHLQNINRLPSDFPADVRAAHIRLRPSIHMPRWASRITLEITDVRVEKLHDISRGDAMDEGCPFPNMAQGDNPRTWYADLWNSINGPGSWDANPWVWVVAFRVVKP